jgi:uncharacterized protein (DUF736 family)
MAYEQRELSGSLFPNDDKTPGDQRPDYRGRCKIDGEEFFMSAWSKTARSGVEYFSVAFQRAETRAKTTACAVLTRTRWDAGDEGLDDAGRARFGTMAGPARLPGSSCRTLGTITPT